MADRRGVPAHQTVAGIKLPVGGIEQWGCDANLCDLDILRRVDQSVRRRGSSSWPTRRANLTRDGISLSISLFPSPTDGQEPGLNRLSCLTRRAISPSKGHSPTTSTP